MSDASSATGKPGMLAGLDASRQLHLDVREDIWGGNEPLARIMEAIEALGPDQALVLRAPFEPVPLYRVLGKRGFAHWTERLADNDFSAWFYRDTTAESGVGASRGRAVSGPRTVTIDVRALEPPQPMMLVLEALEQLEAGDTLVVIHERRPVFLYPQLDERGFHHETEDAAQGLVRIVIQRGAGAA